MLRFTMLGFHEPIKNKLISRSRILQNRVIKERVLLANNRSSELNFVGRFTNYFIRCI